jgi:glycosyltransferase involved in cell wall biosynthesis
MKLAFVVQRYGLEISGGAELLCRLVAEHMKKHCDIEVLTTRALDYLTWENHYPKGREVIKGVPVRRFSVAKARDPERFGLLQNYILENEHREEDEFQWLREEGPLSPSLLRYLKRHKKDYDYFIFFSYRYYQSYWGIHAVPHKSILIPNAEHDPIVHLRLFKDFFRKPQALLYNTFEEREMINTLTQNEHILEDVVGVGSEIPPHSSEKEFRQKHNIKGDYLIYVGRIDENKGCYQLFDYFLRFKKETGSPIKLVLVGSTILKIPSHPDVFYLGFLPEEDKFNALEGAKLLVMPSFYESLSIVILEAWALKKPVLANGRCDVLKGQCLRSNGGLFYHNYQEFKEALHILLDLPELRKGMGENGNRYFYENYRWEVIENKYLSMLDQLEGRK